MPTFGAESLKQLQTCDSRLQRVFAEVVRHFDCKITEGHRGEAAQNAAYDSGHSQLRFPRGKHNALPSRALDVYPYPINFRDWERLAYFAGQVVATARGMGIKLRWGGDWNRDTRTEDEKFRDQGHFELDEP